MLLYIAQDPSDYLSYYKRATAYLSLGRTSSAIDDFSTILDLRPGFDKALLQRAKLYANDGDFSLAKNDLLKHKDATNQEVKDLVTIFSCKPKKKHKQLTHIFYVSWNQYNMLKRQVC